MVEGRPGARQDLVEQGREVSGLLCLLYGLGFRCQVSVVGFGVRGFGVWGVGFGIWSFGFGVEVVWFRGLI